MPEPFRPAQTVQINQGPAAILRQPRLKHIKKALWGLFLLLGTTAFAQESTFDPDKRYPADSLRGWNTSVMKAISEKHPGFYRYTTPERFDYLIDSTNQTIDDSLTELQYYQKLKPLFAQIGCLHTGISLSQDMQTYLATTALLVPLEVFIEQGRRVLVSKQYGTGDSSLVGAEIVAINGKPMQGILSTLLKAVPSDGYNETEKILLLNHRFAFWHQTIIEQSTQFTVEAIKGGESKTYTLQGVTQEVFPTMESLEAGDGRPLEFEVINGVGVLTIHTFARSAIKSEGQRFKQFAREAFRQLEKEGIENLVIDLRYNSGGSDGNAAHLAAHFFDQPFRYWDKIEVTAALAAEIKGAVRLVYRKPVERDGTYRWRKSTLTNEFDYYLVQKPARKSFKGNVYIITNGLCMSSCSDLVAILWHNDKATVVGQESGGGYQGNTSGIMPTKSIPTGLRVTVPLQKYTNAVDQTKNFGHGTRPDHLVVPTFHEWMARKDVEMEYVMKLILEK